MANLLVLGVGPLPFENSDHVHAPGIRTWQLTSVLAARHHFITLCIITFGDFVPGGKPSSSLAVREDLGSNISLVRMNYNPKETVDALRTLHVATRFAAVVSTTDIMNGLAVDLDLDIPLWLDYNGDPFAEKQLQARLYQHDGSLQPQWQLYLKGLLRGDAFSVCSAPQRYNLIGQLGYAGRLNKNTGGHNMVTVIPNCSRVMSQRTPVRTKPLKGNRIPASSFLVLWSGGYNTWCDQETLFHGLESAMKANSSVYFASTGGALEGHDNRSFSRFQDLVSTSEMKDRFIFLGWIPTEEVGSYFEQADLAIFVDRYSVEGELGTRTRMIDWIQYKLPIACTTLCELSYTMADEGLILPIQIGEPESVSRAILKAIAQPEELKEMALSARDWFDKEFPETELFAPLVEWASEPRRAGDSQKHQLSKLSQILMNFQSQTVGSIAKDKQTAKPASTESAPQGISIRQKFGSLFKRKA